MRPMLMSYLWGRCCKDLSHWCDNCNCKIHHGHAGLHSMSGFLWFDGCNHENSKDYDDAAACFVAVIKDCTKNKDLDRGTELHQVIVKRGLLETCSHALITMYTKCGALVKAKELLQVHKSRDTLTWSALIAGCVQKGQSQDALYCYEDMCCLGLSPNAATFACLLKACGSLRAADTGEQIHDEIVRQGLLHNDIVLGTVLVDMYAKCGVLARAEKVLDGLSDRNVVTWNALIAGYIQHSQGEKALSCFERMQGEGISPNPVTFSLILKACGSVRAADKGEQIHEEIARQGLLANDVVLVTALVDMYGKCGALDKARQALEGCPLRTVVSWNALIAGYAQHGKSEQALNCFERMLSEGISPNVGTFPSILKACGSLGALDKGEEIHNEFLKQGLLENNAILVNAVVDMYAKCGDFNKAKQLLEKFPGRDVISWNALMAGYIQHGQCEQALSCFEKMQCKRLLPDRVTFMSALKACGIIGEDGKGDQIHAEIARQGLLGDDVVLGSALVDMHAKCGALGKARQMLEGLPVRDLFAWNSLITGYAQQGESEEAINCFEQMQCEGLCPNLVTFICILNALSGTVAFDKGQQIHVEIARLALLGTDVVLDNALVDFYAKCGALFKAQQVLEELPVRDIVSWSTLISGYVEQDRYEEALQCFEMMQHDDLCPDAVTFVYIVKACGCSGALDKGEQIHENVAKQGLLGNDVVLGTALVNMYAKCGALDKAQKVLEELLGRDFVLWYALILGYAQTGQSKEALACLDQMQCDDCLSPGTITFICILKACGIIGAGNKGRLIHHEIARQGLLRDSMVLGTALVDMYAKCGALKQAQLVLEELSDRDAVSWNALLTGYVERGQGEQVLKCLERMQQAGAPLDAATLSCVLSACSLLGIVEDAESHFKQMMAKFGLEPNLEHFTCMVDLFGRTGHLRKAAGLIQSMTSCDSAVWSALLDACRKWGDLEVGRWAFEHAIQMNVGDGAAYALAGMQEEAKNIGAMRKQAKLQEAI